MTLPPGSTDESVANAPAKEILKRIDIGLVTAIAALFLSFVGVITSRATFKMNQETQKARVLPIVEVDMGYERLSNGNYDFAVTLRNSGSGLAHLRRVTPEIDGEPVTDYQTFQDAIMNRRMRGWARLTEGTATGYLRPGESRQPVHFAMNSASREVDTYLRGTYGTPLSGMDIVACYCSVFDDCWTVRHSDRSVPKPVDSCGVGETLVDAFADYRDQRAGARIVTSDDADTDD